MLCYCRSTDLSKLADHLLRNLNQNPLSNPLSPEIFVVQNHGMAHWFSLYMAEKKGIAANLKFEFPAERIWSLIRVVDPEVPETLPSDRGPMTWAILHILKNDDDSRLKVLKQYAEDKSRVRQEVRRWQLAGRIADVFDQYLTYRPEMIVDWQKEDYEPQSSFERWQSILWNKLIVHWKKNAGSGYDHRSILQQKIIEAIDNEEIDSSRLPERVTVFGLSTMPPVYLKVLVKLSGLIDVHFYLLLPGEDISNPLNESLGTTGREYQDILEQFISENEIETERTDLNNSADKSPKTLFQSVKADLLGKDGSELSSGYDGTIQVHSCHSARREVEVLYDRLLSMFDEDEALNPSDVLVMAPDLEIYAPEIEAVFGTVEEDLPEIPFHLAEQNTVQVNPIFNTVEKLLEIAESRFKVTEVLDLLDSTSIREKFRFTDDHLQTLERWIDETHIRWGIDKQSKAIYGLPKSNSFTWKAGLNRMMLGYAMKPDEDNLFNGIYPYREVEQSEDALLTGRFIHLMESLFQFHQQIRYPQTLDNWVKLLNRWIFRFLPEQEEFFGDLQQVRDLITRLAEQKELAGFSDEVPFRIIRSYLQGELERHKAGGWRSGRGVTFSSMIPMRNIPAKVICMLGMNDNSFPRSKLPIAFDLMNRNSRPGDRSHSKEDRQLFLETLHAAKECIYFSYIGQSNRQDTSFPPSVVLQELIDYLMQQYGLEEENILTEHPLQPFSIRYFRKNNAEISLFSYSRKCGKIAENLANGINEGNGFLTSALPDPEPEHKKITLNELIRFFQHPAKFLLQNRFGIYLNQDKILDEDREPFRLQGLEGYRLGQDLLERQLNDRSLESYKRVAVAIGMLPEGWPGEQAFSQKLSDVKEFGTSLQDILKQEKLKTMEVDLEIANYRITGKLDHVYSSEQVLYRFGSMRPKDLIELWIKHLAFQNVKPEPHPGQSRFYTRGKRQPVEFYHLPPVLNSLNLLEHLLGIYWSGLKENTFFFPEISFTFAHEVCFRNNEPEKGIQAAGYKWQDDYSPYPREGDDPYNKLLTGGVNPLANSSFQEISISFWKPFFDILNQGVE